MNTPPSKDVLKKLYLDEELPMWKIAETLNIAVGSVHKYLKMYMIPTREPHKGFKGKHHKDKTREIISQKTKGKKVSIETRLKISQSRKLKGVGHKKNTNDGYIRIYCPTHPKSTSDGYVFEHRLIMEKHIGRYLRDDEVVHHINHVRNDNRLENLELMTFKEHASLHMRERWEKKKGAMTYQ